MSFFIQKQFFEVNLKQTQQKNVSSLFHKLKELLSDWYFQCDKNNSIKALTIQLRAQKFKNLYYLLKVDLNSDPDILSITYFILHNNIPFKIQSRNHRIKLYSFLMRINTNILFGKFSICPKSGLLIYNFSSFLTQTQMVDLKNPQSKKLNNNLQIFQKIEENCLILQFYLAKIFQLLNIRVLLNQNQQQQNKTKKNKTIKFYDQQLNFLQNLLPFTHQDINFLIKSNFQIKQNLKIYSLKSIKPILKIIQKNFDPSISLTPQISDQKIKQILWLSRSNSPTINRQKTYKTQIFFQKDTLQKVKNIAQNVNCSVDYFTGNKFHSSQFRQKNIFYFVKKSPITSKGQKNIQREKKFLDLLMQNGGRHDIGQYYDVSTVQSEVQKKKSHLAPKIKPWQQCSINMAYYPLNVGQYVHRRKEIMSQTSKLLLFLKIQKALSYLHSERSQHLDLKPENVMIDNQQNIKLIDFGQSIHQKLPLSSKPGVSIPYSPPQFFSKYKFNPYRCDIYSFGVMLYQILFESFPQNLPSRKEKALVFYKSSTQYANFFQFQPQNLENSSERKFSQLFTSFCLKCMNQNPILRPSISWIRVYLKKLIELSDNY